MTTMRLPILILLAFLSKYSKAWAPLRTQAARYVPPSACLLRSTHPRPSGFNSAHCGFSPTSTLSPASTRSTTSFSYSTSSQLQESSTPIDDVVDDSLELDGTEPYTKAYSFLRIGTMVSWTLIAFIVLTQQHPDPRFSHCTVRHNLLTFSQALMFPLPLLWSTFSSLKAASVVGWGRLESATYRRLNLGLAATSLWLAASTAFPAYFCFGYDLIPFQLKILTSATFLASAGLTFKVWTKTVSSTNLGQYISRIVRGCAGSVWKLPPAEPSDDPDKSLLSSLYALTTVGLLWFAILPVLSYYPLATVPTILGKRLARPAAAFYFLAAVMTYCLKDAADRARLQASTFRTLRRGLAVGTSLHLVLVLAKLVGVDGGGLLLPGTSLWEVYPAMMAVPFSTGASLLLHAVISLAAWTK